jgi:hypothetical protein
MNTPQQFTYNRNWGMSDDLAAFKVGARIGDGNGCAEINAATLQRSILRFLSN